MVDSERPTSRAYLGFPEPTWYACLRRAFTRPRFEHCEWRVRGGRREERVVIGYQKWSLRISFRFGKAVGERAVSRSRDVSNLIRCSPRALADASLGSIFETGRSHCCKFRSKVKRNTTVTRSLISRVLNNAQPDITRVFRRLSCPMSIVWPREEGLLNGASGA